MFSTDGQRIVRQRRTQFGQTVADAPSRRGLSGNVNLRGNEVIATFPRRATESVQRSSVSRAIADNTARSIPCSPATVAFRCDD